MPFDMKPLTIDTLGDLDDKTVRRLVDKALQEALTDCDNRPNLESARRVAIIVTMKPITDDRAGMKAVEVAVNVKHTVPPRAGRKEYLRTSVRGDEVHAFLPDNYEQPMFDPPEGPEVS